LGEEKMMSKPRKNLKRLIGAIVGLVACVAAFFVGGWGPCGPASIFGAICLYLGAPVAIIFLMLSFAKESEPKKVPNQPPTR